MEAKSIPFLKTARGPLMETHELHELILQKVPLKILQAGYAQFFDLKETFDKSSKYLNMLSSPEQFANYMKSQNLKKDDTFVIYDDFGMIGACRAWWTMKVFGINNVYILNGSSIKWKNDKLPLETTSPKPITPAEEIETFQLNSNLLINIDEVKQISKQIQNGIEGFEMVDTRVLEMFNGTLPDQRPEVRGGNIPGSKHFFFKEAVNEDWSFKNEEQLKELFQMKGIELKNTNIVNTCRSGMTACMIYFAEELLGVKDKVIYDGSWTEFGSLPL